MEVLVRLYHQHLLLGTLELADHASVVVTSAHQDYQVLTMLFILRSEFYHPIVELIIRMTSMSNDIFDCCTYSNLWTGLPQLLFLVGWASNGNSTTKSRHMTCKRKQKTRQI